MFQCRIKWNILNCWLLVGVKGREERSGGEVHVVFYWWNRPQRMATAKRVKMVTLSNLYICSFHFTRWMFFLESLLNFQGEKIPLHQPSKQSNWNGIFQRLPLLPNVSVCNFISVPPKIISSCLIWCVIWFVWCVYASERARSMQTYLKNDCRFVVGVLPNGISLSHLVWHNSLICCVHRKKKECVSVSHKTTTADTVSYEISTGFGLSLGEKTSTNQSFEMMTNTFLVGNGTTAPQTACLAQTNVNSIKKITT